MNDPRFVNAAGKNTEAEHILQWPLLDLARLDCCRRRWNRNQFAHKPIDCFASPFHFNQQPARFIPHKSRESMTFCERRNTRTKPYSLNSSEQAHCKSNRVASIGE